MKQNIITFLIVFSLGNSTCQTSSLKKDTFLLEELTDQQKIEDIKFIIEFIKFKSPFRNVLEREFNIPDLKRLEEDFTTKALNSKSNKEFIQIIRELIQILGQGNCHTSILSSQTLFEQFEPLGDTTRLSSKLGISKKAISLGDHWLNQLDYNYKHWYSDLDISYINGNYITNNEFNINGETLNKGSIITSIDGLKTLDYILSVQHLLKYRWDTKLKAPYSASGSPLSINNNVTKKHWQVEFLTPDNNKVTFLLEKKKGFKNTMNYPSLNKNILCKELRDDLAYIKVYGFPDTINIKKDRKIILTFFENAKQSYQNVIIDFRGHGGGNAVYGENVFVRPFLDKKYIYTQHASVEKEMFDNSIRNSQTLERFKRSFARVIDFGNVQKINFNELPETIRENNYINDKYYYFKTTRTITPKNRYRFRGKIFLLIDNNCYSAAETIIRIHQQLGLSTIIGVNSGGGEGAVHAPLIYELPNCHLLFRTEIEMTFNLDGTINELYGTDPTINLEPSTYPTSFPRNFNTNVLLQDKWIDWIINNEL